jgi:hypothetical protein
MRLSGAVLTEEKQGFREMSKTTKGGNEEGGDVSFRLGVRHRGKLNQRAGRAGINRHQQAKKIVEAALDEREEEARLTRIELADLRAEVEAMRAGLIKILTGLVATWTDEASSREQKMSLDSARSFVQSAFRKGGGKT